LLKLSSDSPTMSIPSLQNKFLSFQKNADTTFWASVSERVTNLTLIKFTIPSST
jgi:hypothetical protein